MKTLETSTSEFPDQDDPDGEDWFNGGRFEDFMEVYDKPSFLDFLFNHDFVGLHIKDNDYLIIPIEDIHPPRTKSYPIV